MKLNLGKLSLYIQGGQNVRIVRIVRILFFLALKLYGEHELPAQSHGTKRSESRRNREEQVRETGVRSENKLGNEEKESEQGDHTSSHKLPTQ